MSVYFLTYGDDMYKNSKIRIEQEAKNSRLFDYINIYDRKSLSEEFVNLTRPYLDNRRGGGFWLFKPFLLKKTFDTMNNGDYCIYTDAGCTINPYGGDRFREYLNLLNDETGILSFRMDGLDEELYTTEEIFKQFSIDNDSLIRKSGQIMATILIMRKCEKSTSLVNEYYNLALSNPKLFSDDYNKEGNCDRFIDNRHDQSILSVLRKKHGSVEILDETYADTMDGWNNLIYIKKIPFLATRIRN